MNNKILSIIVAVISLIGIVLFVKVGMTDKENLEAVSNAVSPLVTYSIGLLIVAVLAAIVVSILGVFKHPAALKKTLIGLVGLAIVLLASYTISPDGQVVDANGDLIAAAGSQVSKLTSTGIWVSLTLLVIGGGFFLFDLLKGIVK